MQNGIQLFIPVCIWTYAESDEGLRLSGHGRFLRSKCADFSVSIAYHKEIKRCFCEVI